MTYATIHMSLCTCMPRTPCSTPQQEPGSMKEHLGPCPAPPCPAAPRPRPVEPLARCSQPCDADAAGYWGTAEPWTPGEPATAQCCSHRAPGPSPLPRGTHLPCRCCHGEAQGHQESRAPLPQCHVPCGTRTTWPTSRSCAGAVVATGRHQAPHPRTAPWPVARQPQGHDHSRAPQRCQHSCLH